MKSILILSITISTIGSLHAMEPFACKVPTNEQRAVQQRIPEDREFAAQRETKRRQASENAARELSVPENTKPQLNIPESGLPKEDQRLANGLAILYQLRGPHGAGLPRGLKNLVLEYCPKLELVKRVPITNPEKINISTELFSSYGNEETRLFDQLLWDSVGVAFSNRDLLRAALNNHLNQQSLVTIIDGNDKRFIKASKTTIEISSANSESILTLPHDDRVGCFATQSFSNGDWYLVSGEYSMNVLDKKGSIYIWNAKTGKLLRKLTDCTNGAIKLIATCVQNDQEWFIVTCSMDGAIRVFNGETGQTIHTNQLKQGNWIDGLATQKRDDGGWNIITIGGPNLEIRDAITNELIESFKFKLDQKNSAYFRKLATFRCNDGRFLIVTRTNNDIRIFDYSAGYINDSYNQVLDCEIARSIIQDLSNSEFPQKGLPAGIQRIIYDYVVTEADEVAAKDREQEKLAALARKSEASHCTVQ